MKEFKDMSITDIKKEVALKREEVRTVRFGIAGSALRNTRTIRNAKRRVARLLTEINRRARNEVKA